jgi:hypothetical protein
VRREIGVVVVVHDLFLEREMRRDAREQGRDGGRRRACSGCVELVVQTIDEIDQLPVIAVDRVDADAERLFPLQQCHGLAP